jgi:hypothetical protein
MYVYNKCIVLGSASLKLIHNFLPKSFCVGSSTLSPTCASASLFSPQRVYLNPLLRGWALIYSFSLNTLNEECFIGREKETTSEREREAKLFLPHNCRSRALNLLFISLYMWERKIFADHSICRFHSFVDRRSQEKVQRVNCYYIISLRLKRGKSCAS